MTITRRQALAAINSGRVVYNRQGDPGTVIELNEHGYRWMRHKWGHTFSFPGVKECVYLSLTDPTKDN